MLAQPVGDGPAALAFRCGPVHADHHATRFGAAPPDDQDDLGVVGLAFGRRRTDDLEPRILLPRDIRRDAPAVKFSSPVFALKLSVST